MNLPSRFAISVNDPQGEKYHCQEELGFEFHFNGDTRKVPVLHRGKVFCRLFFQRKRKSFGDDIIESLVLLIYGSSQFLLRLSESFESFKKPTTNFKGYRNVQQHWKREEKRVQLQYPS